MRGWKAQHRTLSNAKQQHGEHVVNWLKSGSHLSQEDSSLDFCGNCRVSAVIWLWIVDSYAQNGERTWRLLHADAEKCPECQLETTYDKFWTVWQSAKDKPKDTWEKEQVCWTLHQRLGAGFKDGSLVTEAWK